MSDPRDGIGGNLPPLDAADAAVKRLERENAKLFGEAADLHAAAADLPTAPQTDEEVGLIADHILKLKDVVKRMETVRGNETQPYFRAQRDINALFASFANPLTDMKEGIIGRLTNRVGIYNRAKAEREAAERRAQEAREREAAAKAAEAERKAREEAEEAERQAEAAAQAIRRAETDAERAAAEEEMRAAETKSAAARSIADDQGKYAAQHERRADAHERAAEGNGANLSRVTAGGATSSVTKVWAHTIVDADTLLRSLGPLGKYLSNDTISDAIKRAIRSATQEGSIGRLSIPGVRIYEDRRTNITAVKR